MTQLLQNFFRKPNPGRTSVLLLFVCFCFTSLVAGQLPETDIFLMDLKMDANGFHTGTPVNITNRKGYDNQPAFSPDGTSLLFVSVTDTVSSDIFSYEMNTKKTTRLTRTPESEFSPAYTPDRKSISVVRVDADSGQRMYELQLPQLTPHLIRGTDSIGYYCRLNGNEVAMFILGNTNTLQVLDISKQERRLVADRIGRCLKLNNTKDSMFFVEKENDSTWYICSMEVNTYKTSRICKNPERSEDFAVLPDGSFIIGKNGILYRWKKDEPEWKPVADLSTETGNFYRITVDPNGHYLALVGYTGEKP